MAARKKRATRKKTPAKPRRSGDTQKKRRGQKPFVPTEQQRVAVKSLIGYGLTYREVADVIVNPDTKTGISVNTLQKHFPDELARGRSLIKAKLHQSIYEKAFDPKNPKAHVCLMFILKCKFGWTQSDAVANAIVEGAKSGVLVVPRAMSPDEWVRKQREANEAREAPEED